MSEVKPERLSDAELDLILAEMEGDLYLGNARALVNEVRRLRGLIVDGVIANEGVTCPLCPGRGVVSSQYHHVAGCPAEELEAEAEAIRKEQT